MAVLSLFCGCGIFTTKGFAKLIPIVVTILCVANCVFYFKKFDKDNKVVAGIVCFLLFWLVIIVGSFSESSELNEFTIPAAVLAVFGMIPCFTWNAWNRILKR
ncbi:MAG: hypothetical protein J5817_02665 [Treponema sp.]|nr:hypothetical protein [Treponema sp.]